VSVRVSVVIPVRNDMQRLRTLLESLSLNTVEHEVVVVDNGSQDSSVGVARNAGAFVLEFPAINVGALRNRGVDASVGDILAFVDSDHEVPSDWLENGIARINESPSVAACGAHYLPPVNGTWVQKTWAIHRLRGPSPATVSWLGSGNLFVKRDAFLKIGGFREELVAAEDVDLCYRLGKSGGQIILDKRIANIHHGEPRTLSDFVRKEYWRGSSGLRAWCSNGFPLRDVPSFLWPLWHLVLGVLAIGLAIVFGVFPSKEGALALSVVCLMWFVPAMLLSLKTCITERQPSSIAKLTILYFAYGVARAGALFKS